MRRIGGRGRRLYLRIAGTDNYKAGYLARDIFIGIIIALVSIPISMGYAMIAGLPAQYGLYGSVLPILIYSLTTTSPRFIFGVDAAPAALTGGLLFSMGIAPLSDDAIRIVPVITFFVFLWLILFYFLKAGRLTRFVSSPVMGGFITGIGTEIILMQVPKLFGGNAVRGELPELLYGIYLEAKAGINLLSVILGISTIIIILIFRKLFPKVPMTVILLASGGVLQAAFDIESMGVKLLSDVSPGLPALHIPDLTAAQGNVQLIFTTSLTIALVITAETLLSTQSFGAEHGDKLDPDREILAYALANLAAVLTGCCPVNGSVSRTGIADQYGIRSQMAGITASITMVLVLIFGTGLIGFLPVPILTGIVISALSGILEFGLAHKLRKIDKTEMLIFYAVFLSVILVGTMAGVVVGILLSFLTYVIRSSKPVRGLLGVIPGQKGFHRLDRGAIPIKDVIIYRFQSPLFFANASVLKEDIEEAAGSLSGAKAVIIDASNISSIDVTAAEMLLRLYKNLKARGIKLFITEQRREINDQLHGYGCGEMLRDWACLPHIEQALKTVGISDPCSEAEVSGDAVSRQSENDIRGVNLSDGTRSVMATFEWAFGDDAERQMMLAAEKMIDLLTGNEDIGPEEIRNAGKNMAPVWDMVDEEVFLDIMEMQIAEYAYMHGDDGDERIAKVEDSLAKYHALLDRRLKDPELIEDIIRRRRERELIFKEKNPDAYEVYRKERHRHRQLLREKDPVLLSRIDEIRSGIDEEGNEH